MLRIIMRRDSKKIVMVIEHIIAALESLTFQLSFAIDGLFSSLAHACSRAVYQCGVFSWTRLGEGGLVPEYGWKTMENK